MKQLQVLLVSFLFSTLSIANTSDTLVVGYTDAPPFIIGTDNGPQGVNIWLWNKIATDLDLNFKLKEVEFPDLIQGLKDHTIDISINPLTLTPERATFIQFTSPFYTSNSAAVVLDTYQNQFLSFIKKFFAWEFLTGMALLVILVAIFGLLTWMFERKHNDAQFRKGLKGIWDGLWWSAVTMTTVGYGDKTPKSRGGKIIALIWMFTALLFISGLTASIASTILSTSSSSQVYRLDDLRTKRVGSISNTGSLNYLRNRFFRNLKAYQNIEAGLDGLEKKEIEVFIYDEPILTYRLNERTDHQMIKLPIKFNSQLYGFGVSPEYHDLLPQLSERILYYTNTLEWPVMLQEYDLEEF